jgi:hypothetical protein
MDLALFARVLWRWKALVVVGLIVAAALAALSMVRISSDGIRYRDSQLWASTTRLGVTQNGFPWGRLLAQIFDESAEPKNPEIPVANPGRLNELAVLYAELATSDPVRRLMLKDGPIPGKIVAIPVVGGDNRVMLPLIDLTAIATSPRGAVQLAERSATAVGSYIRDQQRLNKVPASDRVVIEQLEQPKQPTIWQGRSKTLPIVVFLAVMMATIGLAFLLENLRPLPAGGAREHEDQPSAQRELTGTERRRS